MPANLSEHPDGILIDVWVVPGASRNEVTGLHDGALRVRVAAPPEGGKANRAAAAAIAGFFAVRRARVVGGATSRRKQILVEGTGIAAAAERLKRMG